MVRAKLYGEHSFPLTNGKKVHVWKRDGVFLVRGSVDEQRFGESLGCDEETAKALLLEIIANMNRGVYRRPTHPSRKQRLRRPVGNATLVELSAAYTFDVQRRRGKKTAQKYRNLLNHVLAFAREPDVARAYPYAASIDRNFALGLREFLARRLVTRNGRRSSVQRPMAKRSIGDILQRFGDTLRFACRPDTALLPVDFVNPVEGLPIEQAPPKDPFRHITLTADRRALMVRHMDRWQFLTLSPLFILPVRPEELTGLLIDDIDWKNSVVHFGTRFGGNDFTKGRQAWMLPFPPELTWILCAAAGLRGGGPLFLRRSVLEGGALSSIDSESSEALEDRVSEALIEAKSSTAQDAKQVVRKCFREAGGICTDELRREFRRLCAVANLGRDTKLYGCREAVTTELERTNLSMLLLRYLTGHSSTDIMNKYTAFDLRELKRGIRKYWKSIAPLLKAISDRAKELGVECLRDVA